MLTDSSTNEDLLSDLYRYLREKTDSYSHDVHDLLERSRLGLEISPEVPFDDDYYFDITLFVPRRISSSPARASFTSPSKGRFPSSCKFPKANLSRCSPSKL